MKRIFITLFLIVTSNLYSQSGIFGFRYEFSTLNSNYKSAASPINLYLGLRLPTVPNLFLKLQGGYAYYSEEYSGLNGNAVLDYLFYRNFKASVGINLHSNNGIAHGTEIFVKSYDKTHLNFLIGAGIYAGKNTIIDILVLVPTEKKYGYESNGYERIYYKLFSVVKIGIEHYF